MLTWASHEQLTFGVFQIHFMPWQQNKTRQNKKADPRMKRVAFSSCPRHDCDSEDPLIRAKSHPEESYLYILSC